MTQPRSAAAGCGSVSYQSNGIDATGDCPTTPDLTGIGVIAGGAVAATVGAVAYRVAHGGRLVNTDAAASSANPSLPPPALPPEEARAELTSKHPNASVQIGNYRYATDAHGEVSSIQSVMAGKFANASTQFTQGAEKLVFEQRGQKGTWNRILNNPGTNTIFVVDDQFIYRTDHLSRVVAARGILPEYDSKWQRNSHQQSKSVRIKMDRENGDVGFHIFGRMFTGPGEGINLININTKTNGPTMYGKLDDMWKSSLTHGTQIEVNFIPSYTGNSMRPSGFSVEWIKDGVLNGSKNFLNPK